MLHVEFFLSDNATEKYAIPNQFADYFYQAADFPYQHWEQCHF